MFSGSGVVKAVKLEESGPGAFLFTDDECAEFYNKNYGEPIFSLGDRKILGWAGSESSLMQFIGASLLRLLKLLSTEGNGNNKSVIQKFVNNIKYAFAISSEDSFPLALISLILSSPAISVELRSRTIAEMGIDECDIQIMPKEMVDDWLQQDDVQIFFSLVDFDSSIPSSSLLLDIIRPYNENIRS